VNAAQENNKLVLKQIKVLENSLDKNLTKFNETIAKNRELRSKVDQFRRERVVFDVRQPSLLTHLLTLSLTHSLTHSLSFFR
jgi:hypothetical protein